jgi:hypothetical protein
VRADESGTTGDDRAHKYESTVSSATTLNYYEHV